MAATRVQSKTGTTSPGATLNITFDSNVTAGNLITAQVSVYNQLGTAICTVTGGGTWATHESDQNGSNSVHIASAENATGGATTVTITITGSTGDRYITAVIEEWSGVLTSGVFDVSSSNNGTGTAASTGATAAKVQNNELVLALIGCGSDNAVVPSGFSTSYLLNNSASFQPIGAGYKSVNASGTESASGTLLGSDNWAAAIATFKESSAGSAFNLDDQAPIGMVGALTIQGDIQFEAVINLAAQAPVPMLGTMAVQGDVEFQIKKWRVPTNAPAATAAHMIVFSGTGPNYTILAQGGVTVDASGFADLAAVGTIGTKAFALLHNYDDNTATTSIFGGPAIATIIDAG